MTTHQEFEQLLIPTAGERFEDKLEAGLGWVRRHPALTATILAGAIATPFVVKWGINKYHEVKARNDIAQAEQLVEQLGTTQDKALRDFKDNEFIIKDELEPGLEGRISKAGEKSKEFWVNIDDGKALFEAGKYKEVRAMFEGDTELKIPSLLDAMEAEIAPVAYVSEYSLDLREHRDSALTREGQLKGIMSHRDSGFKDSRLQNSMGVTLAGGQKTQSRIAVIAKRRGVMDSANSRYESARTSYTSAHDTFNGANFEHYTVKLDGTFDIADYDRVIGKQASVFSSKKSGDSSVRGLSSYESTLREQWFTVVSKRWEDSHQESYYVTIDNPDYREWTEQESYQDCQTKYRQSCRQRANADGSIDEQCVEVSDGETCTTKYKTVHKDNGAPKTVEEERFRTIYEYWVTIETHTTSGVKPRSKDLGSASLYRQQKHQKGWQVWKPCGDDTEYSGKGRLGPFKETPYIDNKCK